MADELYVWISRWETFQHYAPERDRVPAWIKSYTKQLDDERYLDLTDRQRSLVRDLREMFAIAHGRIRYDASKIARRRSCHTRDDDLRALNQAGLIEFVSRETLEHRLDELYSGSRATRARPRARGEGEKEQTKTPPSHPSPAVRPPARAEIADNGQGGRAGDEEGQSQQSQPEFDYETILKDIPF